MATDLERELKGGRRRILFTVLVLLGVGLGLSGATWWTLRAVWGVGPIARPFDREVWLTPDRHDGDQRDRRERMVRNLVKRHLRLGMTRAEVGALLGPKDPDPLLSDGGSGDWIYMLGATFLGKLRVLRWGLSGDRLDSAEGFGSAADAFEIRALRLGFDGERLARIEIVSM